MHRVAVVGSGPAGLMAAEVMAAAGMRVDVYDAMPSVGRKLLLAGKGGLNLTHSEARDAFAARYGDRRTQIEPLLDAFDAEALRAWAHGLGIETFVGTSGRVFPTQMKAAPLLRAWLHRLRGMGVKIHVRHRWQGWAEDGSLRFAAPHGELDVTTDAVVLALGGASWPRLGSDGAWAPLLAARGVPVHCLRPANCGFDAAWSEHLRTRYAGAPLKAVIGSCIDVSGNRRRKQGEMIVTETGVEGGLIYALSAPLRDAIEAHGSALLELDLAPDWPHGRLYTALSHPRGSRSMASHLQSRAGLKGVKVALLRELVPDTDFADPAKLTTAIKSLRVELVAARPVAEAISSAGGVAFEALDERLMIRSLPGVFCAGEMLDWEAPTGGYLLTACFAAGRAAGLGAVEWLKQ